MQNCDYKSEEVSKELILKSLDQVFEDTIIGNSNFFVLDNTESGCFMQTIFADGSYTVEFSPSIGALYKKLVMKDDELQKLFIGFFNGDIPSLDDWVKIK
jgi:hypothetical protein